MGWQQVDGHTGERAPTRGGRTNTDTTGTSRARRQPKSMGAHKRRPYETGGTGRARRQPKSMGAHMPTPVRGKGWPREVPIRRVIVKHRGRRSLRLKGFDYSLPGAYFVTVVVQKGWPLFGEVVEDQVRLNEAGEMVRTVWGSMPDRFPSMELDTFVVMPNHVHGIVAIGPSGGPQGAGGQSPESRAGEDQVNLGDVVSAFKSLTTAEYARNVKSMGWRPFRRRLWQRSYYDHVVRDEEALRKVREYILGNPTLWSMGRRHARDDDM